MSIEAMKQALKFCEDIGDLRGPYPFVNETSIVADSRKVLTALRQAIAEAEKQEPVAWQPIATAPTDTEEHVHKSDKDTLIKQAEEAFESAKEKGWVGLTDEDIDLYGLDEGVTDNKAPAWLVTYARGIEAKLKEKNHG
jgi:hypothetical protein